MRYHSVSSAVERDYLVHPYRLAFAHGGLYLLAFVPAYKDVRTFAVDRIEAVSLEKQTFVPKERIGDEVFANSLGVNTGPAAPRRTRVRNPRGALRPRARLAFVAAIARGRRRHARAFDERVSRLGAPKLDSELGPFCACAVATARSPRNSGRDLRAAIDRYPVGE